MKLLLQVIEIQILFQLRGSNILKNHFSIVFHFLKNVNLAEKNIIFAGKNYLPAILYALYS
jgi:hypothetical protein